MNLSFLPATRPAAPLTVLCLGAHSDDIEIGCGGTILKLIAARAPVEVVWVVFSGDARRAREARASAKLFLKGAARARVDCHDFRVSYFPSEISGIKDVFETIKASVTPDVIFTHTRHDLHQDHRVVCELTWNTFRSHTILEYEIVKYDGDTGSPNVFVELSRATVDRKVRHLLKCFGTQRDKQWFSADTFEGIARLRGVQCASQPGFAEAFYARKLSVF
jgi:LmbE family N-acetylglucosaminyl deacetylase